MSWWLWVLLWLVILGGTVAVLFQIGVSLWRQVVALGKELSVASERVEALTEEVNKLEVATPAVTEPAIFASPAQLRLERARRGTGRSHR